VAALDVPVIEDCAMCLGTEVDGVAAGGASQVAVCSFYATKVLTSAGEGGMVLTDADAVAECVRGRREYDGLDATAPRRNCKMTEVAAAVGRVQLQRLPDFVARRRHLARQYGAKLADVGLSLPAGGAGHIFHRYVVAGSGAGEAVAAFEALGVAARRPVYRPLHRDFGLADDAFPGAARAWERDLSLPLYPSLTDGEADRVVTAARRVFGS